MLPTALFLSSLAAAAVPTMSEVELTLAAARPADAGTASGCQIVVAPVGGVTEALQHVSRSIAPCRAVPATLDLALNPDVIWELRVESASHWATPVTWMRGSPAPLLRAWRTAVLRGTLTVDERVPMPEKITARFEPAVTPEAPKDLRSADAQGAEPRGEALCPVNHGTFVCKIPATRSDLRLHARGFVSRPLWNLDLAAGMTRDLGAWRLIPGASVVGRVISDADGAPLPGCTVDFRLKAGGIPERSPVARLGRSANSVVTDEHGFFLAEGLAPGTYELTVRKQHFAERRLSPVAVVERAETEIRHAIALSRPLDMRVSITPPADPSGSPWSVHVLEPSLIAGSWDERFAAQVDENGLCVRQGMNPGDYMIRILSSSGSEAMMRRFELSPATTDVTLEVEILVVTGSVRLGKRPLATSLLFGGHATGAHVSAESGEDGEFVTWLPGTGSWEVRVDSDEPRVSRTLKNVKVDPDERGEARVEINLPSTAIEGVVVDPDGKPASGAHVVLIELNGRTAAQTISDAEGRFALSGVAEGKVVVHASKRDTDDSLRSAPLAIDAVEDAAGAEYTLILRKEDEMSGRVVTPLGQGVAHAMVYLLPDRLGLDALTIPSRALTDLDGGFTIKVEPSVLSGQLIALAAGYALRSVPWNRSQGVALEIRVDSFGGTLRLDVSAVRRLLDAGRGEVIVFQEHMPLQLSFLDMWAGLNGVPQRSNGERVIPHMATSTYRACALALPSMVTARCAEGHLVPGGSLVLRVPPQ